MGHDYKWLMVSLDCGKISSYFIQRGVEAALFANVPFVMASTAEIVRSIWINQG